jgi:O-methyltransferase
VSGSESSDSAKLDTILAIKTAVANSKLDDAAYLVKQVAMHNPRWAWARLLVSEALIYTGRELEAEEILTETLTRDPRNLKGLQLLSLSLERRGRLLDSRDVLVLAARTRPDDAALVAQAAKILRESGNPLEAETLEKEHHWLDKFDISRLAQWKDESFGGEPERGSRIPALYLDLLEKIICNSIYQDGSIIAGGERSFDAECRNNGRDIPILAHSMIGSLRLRQLRRACETVISENIFGDFFEAGVWRGGASILMSGVLKAYGDKCRKVWVADSFSGLPPPDPRYEKDSLTQFNFHERTELAVSIVQVRDNFSRYDLFDERVMFVQGLFHESLPTLPPLTIAVLRLDGDLYSSTMDCLVNLYDRVVPGGFVIIDDYGVVIDARRAVLDFRRERTIDEPMFAIDGDGIYWRKGAERADTPLAQIIGQAQNTITSSEANNPTTDKIAATEARAWEFMWVFWKEGTPFLSLFRQLDTRNLLELACGHGRHSEYVLSNFGDRVRSLVMMDILQSNIDWCLKRFGNRDKVKFIRNSGTGFQPVEEASVTAIFCYDAMVHFHRSVVLSYLNDAKRVLISDGKALLHHSNYASDPDVPFSKNPRARAFMSASLFRSYAENVGLEVVSQQIIPWGNTANHDCLTLVRKP